MSSGLLDPFLPESKGEGRVENLLPLLAHFHRSTFVRAQAALLLKERGYNIETLRSISGQ